MPSKFGGKIKGGGVLGRKRNHPTGVVLIASLVNVFGHFTRESGPWKESWGRSRAHGASYILWTPQLVGYKPWLAPAIKWGRDFMIFVHLKPDPPDHVAVQRRTTE